MFVAYLDGLSQPLQCRGLHWCYNTCNSTTSVHWFDPLVTRSLPFKQQDKIKISTPQLGFCPISIHISHILHYIAELYLRVMWGLSRKVIVLLKESKFGSK